MNWGRLSQLCLFGVIGIAVVGYVVGLSDGVPQPNEMSDSPFSDMREPPDVPLVSTAELAKQDAKLIPATAYADMGDTYRGPTAVFAASAKSLPQQTEYDLFAKVVPSEADKKASSRIRASRRAFNGAPPIIPHAVVNTNDAACYACHGKGLQIEGLKASVMSHGFLANCLQCHAPPAPAPFQMVEANVESTFVGLPAPGAGKRAFPGAPPTIPHSQWMRENCNACHGGPNGWAGMESTHPWRTNCTQCHAPSAVLDQVVPTDAVPMLPPLEVVTN